MEDPQTIFDHLYFAHFIAGVNFFIRISSLNSSQFLIQLVFLMKERRHLAKARLVMKCRKLM